MIPAEPARGLVAGEEISSRFAGLVLPSAAEELVAAPFGATIATNEPKYENLIHRQKYTSVPF